MSGITTALQIAQNTLQTTQSLLDISANNVSNAGNTNYAVESGVVSSNPAILANGNWYGTGATLQQVVQTRDSSIEQSLAGSNGQVAQYTTLSNQLSGVNAYMADSGTNGISSLLGNYWNSWDQLSQDSGSAQQAGVYAAAQNLAQGITDLHTNLTTSSIVSQVGQTVTSANSLLTQISQYNDQISNQQTQNSTPNTLYDQRYQALQSLSKLIGINYSLQSNGTMNVSLAGSSTNLITGSPPTMQKLEMNQAGDGTFTITAGGTQVGAYVNTVPGSTATGNLQVQLNSGGSGQLQGLMQSLSSVTNYSSQLDTFKNALASQVNAAYTSGKATTQAVFNVNGDTATTQSATIAVADTNTALGAGAGDYLEINGKATAAFTAATTLQQVATSINALDTGASPTGVTASIAQTSGGYGLVLTNDAAGATPINLGGSKITNGVPLFSTDASGNAKTVIAPDSANNKAYLQLDPNFTSSSVDGTQALTMANLQNSSIPELGGSQFGEYWTGMQQQLGTDGENATNQLNFSTAMQQQVQTQQQSVSGVSIDQEMMSIMKDQQIYQAAGELVQTTNTMMSNLLSAV
jgi:flagellar hook-associated protein 1 FlgK